MKAARSIMILIEKNSETERQQASEFVSIAYATFLFVFDAPTILSAITTLKRSNVHHRLYARYVLWSAHHPPARSF